MKSRKASSKPNVKNDNGSTAANEDQRPKDEEKQASPHRKMLMAAGLCCLHASR
uniref:Uncharacterized protein n=1 Tax=Romanomermis culicivorax TaxID=13658 RepID=A0A915JRA4_ROMCU